MRQLRLAVCKSAEGPLTASALHAGHANCKHCVFAAFCTNDSNACSIAVGSEDHSIFVYDVNGKQVGIYVGLQHVLLLCHPAR